MESINPIPFGELKYPNKKWQGQKTGNISDSR